MTTAQQETPEPYPHTLIKKTRRRWFERLGDMLLGEPQDREQLMAVLRESEQRHLLNHEALSMIEGVLRVSELQIRDIMIPRSQMVVIDFNAPLEKFLPQVIESGHSRFPVIGEKFDEVLGILLSKDLLKYVCEEKNDQFNLSHILRPAFFVPDSQRLDLLLKEFRQKFAHMAIVLDEYSGVVGLITIEDILEQIVGEIEDEYDDEEDEQNISFKKENTFLVKASTSIEEFNTYFNITLNEDEFDTIGGFLSHLFGHIPKVDEVISYHHLKFKILNADERRVYTLEVTRH